MLLQEAFNDCGLKVESLGHDLKCDSSTISHWAAGRYQANPKIFELIAKRGKFLSTVKLSRYKFDWICEEFGIKEALIAEKLGISKQALSKQKATGFPPDREKEIEKILQQIGLRLMRISKKAA